MLRSRMTIVWIALLALMAFAALATFAQTAPTPWWVHHPTEQGLWSYLMMTNDRIVLYYPNIMPEETARAFLEDRRVALEFVEDFLQVELEKPLTILIHVSLISSSGRAADSKEPTVEYSLPYNWLRRISYPSGNGTAVHEVVHIVAHNEWSPTLSLFLGEGMAVALDFLSRPSRVVDPHLLTSGLMLLNESMPLDELFSTRFRYSLTASEALLNLYYEGASFVLFLIDQFGLQKLRQLYRVSWMPISMLKEEFCRIYDEELAHVERDWLGFLAGYAVGQEARAKRVTQAMSDFSDRIGGSLRELEEYWNTFSFQLVTPPEKVSKEYRTLTSLLIALGSASEQGITPSEAEEAYEAFEKALTEVESSLALWLRAIQMFESVLNLIVDAPDYEDVITKLEEAQTLYRQVGDDGMVARTSEYIAAFQHLQEGKIALMNGDDDLAQSSFSMAWAHFSKLDEQAIIHRVKRLLELSRHVVN